MDGASEEWLANNPHFVFGCDFCTAVETDGSALSDTRAGAVFKAWRRRDAVRRVKGEAEIFCQAASGSGAAAGLEPPPAPAPVNLLKMRFTPSL